MKFSTMFKKTILTKTVHKTKDTRGMEFEYFIYGSKNFVDYDYETKKTQYDINDTLYVSKDFPDVKAKTLKELQKLMGEIG